MIDGRSVAFWRSTWSAIVAIAPKTTSFDASKACDGMIEKTLAA